MIFHDVQLYKKLVNLLPTQLEIVLVACLNAQAIKIGHKDTKVKDASNLYYTLACTVELILGCSLCLKSTLAEALWT